MVHDNLDTFQDDPDMMIPESALPLMQALADGGFECFAVGGCVRDSLLGRVPQDWDFTTNARVEQMKAVFDDAGVRWVPTGEQHGTLTVINGDAAFEVTTYRIDGSYHDGRHPDQVTFTTSLEEDLARRDFTINAIAWSQETGLVDPFEGRDDLVRAVVRCVGDPATRFTEDGLRIMRALRFAATFGFSIESRTARAIHECTPMIDRISRERISAELMKFFSAVEGRYVASLLVAFADVFDRIWDMSDAAKTRTIAEETDVISAVTERLSSNKPVSAADAAPVVASLSTDVSEHRPQPLYAAVARTPPVLAVRLAAFFCEAFSQKDYRHDSLASDDFADHCGQTDTLHGWTDCILEQLRFPRRIRHRASKLVSLAAIDITPDKTCARHVLAACGDEKTFWDFVALRIAFCEAAYDTSSMRYLAEQFPTRKLADQSPTRKLADLHVLASAAEADLAKGTVLFGINDLAISGNDLIAAGWKPGPELGACLSVLFEQVLDGAVENTRESLLAAAQKQRLKDGNEAVTMTPQPFGRKTCTFQSPRM